MTISELYQMFDDMSDFTRIKVFEAKNAKPYSRENVDISSNTLIFSGVFGLMSNLLKQSQVICFGSDYAKDTLYVIIYKRC